MALGNNSTSSKDGYSRSGKSKDLHLRAPQNALSSKLYSTTPERREKLTRLWGLGPNHILRTPMDYLITEVLY